MGKQITLNPQKINSSNVVIGSNAGLSAVAGLTVYGGVSARESVYAKNLAGPIDPSYIKSGGARIGQALMWDGNHWIPSTILGSGESSGSANIDNVLVVTEVLSPYEEGQVVFELAKITYTPNQNAIAVYCNGLRLTTGTDFTETDNVTITLKKGAELGDEYLFETGKIVAQRYGVGVLTELREASHLQDVFNLLVVKYIPGIGNLAVYRNGIKLIVDLDYTETDGTTVTLKSPAHEGDQFVFEAGKMLAQPSPTSFASEMIIATPGQVDFALSQITYTPNTCSIAVYQNGIKLVTGIDYIESSRTSITLTTGADENDQLVFEAGKMLSLASTVAVAAQVFNITSPSQTVFNLSEVKYVPNILNLAVYRNGLKLIPVTDYIETDETTVTLISPAVKGDQLVFEVGKTLTQPSPTAVISELFKVDEAGKTEFNLTKIVYSPNTSSIVVYQNGLKLISGIDYIEAGHTKVQLTAGADLNDQLVFEVGKLITTPLPARVITELATVTEEGKFEYELEKIIYVPNNSNIAVYQNGLKLISGIDYVETSSNIITLVTPAQLEDQLIFEAGNIVSSTDSSENVSFSQSGLGAVSRDLQSKSRDVVCVKDFGATGEGVLDDYLAIQSAWNFCLLNKVDLYFPSGVYLVNQNKNFPFRQDGTIVSLLDCKNITIYGDGPSTILKTSCVDGADVLQLNGLKNVHFKNLQIQSQVSGTVKGSNGVSITGGWDNISLSNIWLKNLAYLDKVTYVDGGNGIYIAGNATTMGSLKVTGIYADGCATGVSYEPDNDLALAQPVNIDVDIVASNCRTGVSFSAEAATAPLPTYSTNGLRIKAKTINCLQDIIIYRCHGVDIECQTVQTKTKSDLLLSYKGVKWQTNDDVTRVVCMYVGYAKNSKFTISGNKRECENKVVIGGAADATSGLSLASDQCDFYLDITGSASNTAVLAHDESGFTLTNSKIYCTTSTATTLPNAFYTATSNNTIVVGPVNRVKSIRLTDSVSWVNADGVTASYETLVQNDTLTTKQKTTSNTVQQWYNSSDEFTFGIKDNGSIASSGLLNATSVGTVQSVLPIYTATGTLTGYIPIYSLYS